MGHEEEELRAWVHPVATGGASRRQFIHTMLGLGLSVPLIAEMLATHMSARAQGTPDAQQTFSPTRRGGGGKLRLLYWQTPTVLNAHLSGSPTNWDASRVVYESLISTDPERNFIPMLAAEMPTVENGGRARDGTWVIWRLKQGVVWQDGKPFTADDVVFTWEYAADPATAATSSGLYENIRRLDTLDEHAVKVVFKEPTPVWFYSGRTQIIPKHLLAEYKGQNAPMPHTTSSRWVPGRTRSSTSSRGMWRTTRSIPSITCPTAPSSTPLN